MRTSYIPWESRAWKPVVGMKIRYRRDKKVSSHSDLSCVATIIEIYADERLAIDRGNRKSSISKRVWMADWEPVPDQDESIRIVHGHLSENDIRRIVREELDHRFRGIESAMRNFLDELFNTTN